MSDLDVAWNVTELPLSQSIHVLLTYGSLQLIGLLAFRDSECSKEARQMGESFAPASKSQDHVPIHGEVEGFVHLATDGIPCIRRQNIVSWGMKSAHAIAPASCSGRTQ